MALIRHISIRNFRSVETLEWSPEPGVNCIVGPGDSGKSTVLDAIDLALSARRYAVFGEADFSFCKTERPVVVDVTLGDLHDSLMDLDVYANYWRGFNLGSREIEDEPRNDLEHVLTVRLTVGDDLLPHWTLFTKRGEGGAESRDLAARDRARVAPTRLGPYADMHLAWGQRSILNRVGAERPDAGAALALARTAAKKAFGESVGTLFAEALSAVSNVSRRLAVDISTDPKALLDTQLVSMGNGQVALHDAREVPLRNLGLGSSRLLVAGLQRYAAPDSCVSLIDEVEHGLEPYRIAQLLNTLGTRKNAFQLFLTTHSPVVLQELRAEQIVIMRRPEAPDRRHRAIPVGNSETRQKALRACAEAFLTPRVLVCEGKTEVGLLRGFDLYNHENGRDTLARCGVYAADGGGAEAVHRALAFADLGYETALLRDNDVLLSSRQKAQLMAKGVGIHQWPDSKSFEAALFGACPDEAISELLEIAADIRSTASIESDILAVSGGSLSLESCLANPGDGDVRAALIAAATRKDKQGKPKNWFKLIEAGERIGQTVIPQHWKGFSRDFLDVIKTVRAWILKGRVPIDDLS